MIADYYILLKIEQSTDLDVIKKAFRKEIAIYHPDNNPLPDARTQFDLLVEAFEVLSDSNKRITYDALLSAQTNNKPVVIEQEEHYKEWQKEAKTKSKKYYDYGLDELLLFDLFILNGDVLDGLLSGTGDLIDGLTEGLEGVFDLF